MIADRASVQEASNTGSRPKFIDLAKNCFAGTLDEAAHLVIARAREGEGGYVSLCNVHLLTLARRDRWVHEVLSGAWMRFADGAPVAWLQRRLGLPTAERVGGPDLVARVLELGRDSHIRHFFLGSTPAVLGSLERRVQTAFPDTEICGSFSPPFGPMGADAVKTMLDTVRASRADIVWVGLGAPKQDLWMKRFTGEFPSTVLVGVGAAFEFLAGAKPRAPRWMRSRGLEWLHRLANEPRRLSGRYLSTNTEFVTQTLLELSRRR